MAKQDLGKIVPTFNGIYNANIVYEKLCIVNYKGSVYVSKQDIPKGTDISNEEYWYLLIEKLKKGVDYFTEEDKQTIIDEVTKLAESDFNKYYDEKKKALDKVASDNTAAFLKTVKDSTTDFNSNVDTQTKAFDAHYDEKVKSFDENSDKQTTAYDTNANKKLNDYNENHKTKMQELNDEATKKITEYDEHSEELRNMAVSTDNELERVKSDILDTGSASDTFIHVEDSCMAKLKELEIEGVCEQETTQGYNLIDYSLLINNQKSYMVGGVTMSYSEDGTLTANGTQTASWLNFFSKNITDILEDGKTYTLWAENYSINLYNNSFYAQIERTNNETGKAEYIYLNTKNITFIVDKTKYSKYVFHINLADRLTTLTNFKNKFMLYEGTDEKVYELYTNGASPNPDYPQEIKTITNSLKVTSCGRNLFSVNIPTMTRNGVTISQDESGIHIKGTSTNITNFLFPTKVLNKLIGKTITFKCNNLANSNIHNISFKSPSANTVYCVIDQYVVSRTYTLSKKLADDLVFSIYILANKTIDVTLQMQLKLANEANTASEYEHYVESLVEANLPEGEFIGKLDDTYKDTLTFEYVADDSKFHLKLNKKVGFRNFNDVSSILYSTLQNDYFLFQIATDYLPSSVMISNNFINAGNYGLNYNHESIFRGGASNNAFQFKIKKDRVTSYDAKGALSFIKNSNTDVYYALNTSYTLDLGMIDMPLAYKEVTNIFTDSDLLPRITAKYYRTFQTTIQNLQINDKTLKQEITDLNNSISDISKRLVALESANVNTVEESEASNDLQN